MVCSERAVVTTKGQMKLFHVTTKVKMATAAVAGRASGIQLCR